MLDESFQMFTWDGKDTIIPVEADTPETRAELFLETLHFRRRVARSNLGKTVISTVFLVFPHPGGIFETLVQGGVLDGGAQRYSSAEEARKGHEDVVRVVRWAQFHANRAAKRNRLSKEE